jgi:hypothetical protein
MSIEKTAMILVLAILCCNFPSFGSPNVILHWFEKVAEGVYEINEPIVPMPPGFRLSDSQVEYLRQLRKEQTSLSFYNFLRQRDYLRKHADNPSIGSGSGMLLPRELVAAIINRRLPIINTYKIDNEEFWHSRMENPKYYCEASLNNRFDYLGVVQLTMMHYLISQNDLRFEKEACKFLDYFYTPFPENLDKAKMKDRDARLCYSYTMGAPGSFLPHYMKKYINLCLKSRKAPKLDPHKAWFATKYAQKCNYYDLKNWPEFVKKPPTEEEMRRFHEISKQWREESAKYDKLHEKSLDETFLKNAQGTLQQKDLTPQEREYLERRINYIKNKKYE